MKFLAKSRHCRGISLMELILVMLAIMIVAGVAWKAGSDAIAVGNNTKVALEVTRLTEALDAFCMVYGDYPPDFHDLVATRNFIKQRFPQLPAKDYPDLSPHSPATALYFWLAGPKGRGFSTNPKNPFETGGTSRIGPFFKFTPDRLKMVEGAMQYFPPRNVKGDPYIYFRGGPKGYDNHFGWNTVHPYISSETGKWINAQSFQILCGGNDGKLGSGNHFPGGSDYEQENYDDLANFTTGSTMLQCMPKENADAIPTHDTNETARASMINKSLQKKK